jgi:FlaA1/EpsC-like NDP-sugar epimerase
VLRGLASSKTGRDAEPGSGVAGRYLDKIVRLPPHSKHLILLSADVITTGFSVLLAAAAAELHAIPGVTELVVLYGSLFAVALLFLLHRFGAHKTVIRYARRDSYYSIIVPVLIAAAISGLGALVFGNREMWGLLYIAAITSGFLLLSSRAVAAALLNRGTSTRPAAQFERVAIYGTGEPARQLAQALVGGHSYQPVMFIEDSPSLVGRILCGLPVKHSKTLAEARSRCGVTQLFIADPALTVRSKAELSTRFVALGLMVKVVPGIDELASGRYRIDDLREVQIEDLLGRDAVEPFPNLLDATIHGRCVMVTGAGGSIGSELCRQIALRAPQRIIALECNEFALYKIECELRAVAQEQNLKWDLIPALGSIGDVKLVRRLLQDYAVDTVYHAAAYKHVPLVESNVISALQNNVFETESFARNVAASQVSRFVLISSDKAVRPVSVMGATKRLQEMTMQRVFAEKKSIRFCAVRFGNVLGSSGSVVPLFTDQIRRGGPVTVTHPEVTRYFMTIPEAVQLVLQAGALASRGEIFILDMGQPVKIVDMAQRMIRLSGKTVLDETNPDGDIAIVFTGLRPGEKMFEELVIGNNVGGTVHPRIFCADERSLPREIFDQQLLRLKQSIDGSDEKSARRICARLTGEQLQPESVEPEIDPVVAKQKVEQAAFVAGRLAHN